MSKASQAAGKCPVMHGANTRAGMSNMAWRARRLGAQLRIEPASAAGGTRVRVEVALPNSRAAQSS